VVVLYFWLVVDLGGCVHCVTWFMFCKCCWCVFLSCCFWMLLERILFLSLIILFCCGGCIGGGSVVSWLVQCNVLFDGVFLLLIGFLVIGGGGCLA